MIVPQNTTGAFSFGTLYSLWNQKWICLLAFIVLYGCVATYTALSPRSYRSEGRMLVRLGRENAVLDPTATSGSAQVLALPISREGEVNSVIEMLRSRALVEKIVDAVTAEVLLAGPHPTAGGTSATGPSLLDKMADLRLYHRTSSRERAVRQVQKKLRTEAPSKSNVVSVTFEAPRPEVAQSVVQAALDCYVMQHIQSNRVPGSEPFLKRKTDELRQRLADREAELERLRNKHRLVAIEEKRRISEQRIGSIQEQLIAAESGLVAAEADITRRRELLKTLDYTVVISKTTGDVEEAVDGMRQQLYSLETKQQDLLTKLFPTHPEVLAMGEQVRSLQRILKEEYARQRSRVTVGRNRTHEEAEIGLVGQEPIVESLRAKAAAMQLQLQRAESEHAVLNEGSRRMTELEREIALLDGSYRRHFEKLEQATTDYELEAQRMSNINVFQPATLETRPVRPNILLNLALGFVFAVLGAAGLGICVDSWRTKMPTSNAPAIVPTRLSLRAEPHHCDAAAARGASSRESPEPSIAASRTSTS